MDSRLAASVTNFDSVTPVCIAYNHPTMEVLSLSLIRKAMLWYFRYPPFSPYASFSCAVEFTAARDYLVEVNAGDGQRVTVQHLFMAALSRVYHEFPVVNASVVGHRIVRHKHVGIAVPIDLGAGKRGGQKAELSAVLVTKCETRSLRDIAERVSGRVSDYRDTSTPNPLFLKLMPLARHIPTRLLHHALDVLDAASQTLPVYRQFHRLFPMTSLVSNVGSTLNVPGGVVSRSATFTPPQRFLGLGSFIGILPVQQEAIVVDGEVTARPMLPFSYIFDHRIFDGVMCGRVLTRLCEILRDPVTTFGTDGNRPGPT